MVKRRLAAILLMVALSVRLFFLLLVPMPPKAMTKKQAKWKQKIKSMIMRILTEPIRSRSLKTVSRRNRIR